MFIMKLSFVVTIVFRVRSYIITLQKIKVFKILYNTWEYLNRGYVFDVTGDSRDKIIDIFQKYSLCTKKNSLLNTLYGCIKSICIQKYSLYSFSLYDAYFYLVQ